MKFTNLTEDTLDVNALGFSVAPSKQTPELTDEQALGFVNQPDRWKPDHPRVAQRLIDDDAARHAPEPEPAEAAEESTTEQGAE